MSTCTTPIPRIRLLEPISPPRTIVHAFFRTLITKLWLTYKAIVHFFSGRNELERICLRANGIHTPEVTIAIEKAILNSKQIANSKFSSLLTDLTTSQETINPSRLLDLLVMVKHIDVLNKDYTTRIRPHLERALREMCGMCELAHQIETLRQAYDNRNPDHEAQLMRLWDSLRPDVRLPARIHPAWGEIGFQGHDPSTDFRGMGILGLHNLVDFASLYPTRALAVLGDCTSNGLKWFSFAITGINMTADVHSLLTHRYARHWFYQYGSTLTSFTTLYCTLFTHFNQYWKDVKPLNVMEYNRVHQIWMEQMKQEIEKGILTPIRNT